MPGRKQDCACPVRPLPRTTFARRAALALLMLVAAIVALVAPADAETRIALVITNQSYPDEIGRLANPHRDGTLIIAALKQVGFADRNIIAVRDADQPTMRQAVADLIEKVEQAGPDTVVFLYYSGHGAADRTERGENYLIPTGARITLARQLPIQGVSLTEITKSLERVRAKARFVVIDACRNVAFTKGLKDAAKGFVPERRLDGIIVAFATRPGETAEDNSSYARALSEVLPTPGLLAEQVFKATQRRVAELSRGIQVPWTEDGLLTEFRFKEAAAAAGVAPPAATVLAPPVPAAPAPSKQAAVVQTPAPQPTVSARQQPPYSHWDCKSNDAWCSIGLEMRVLPTGSYMRGSSEAEIAALVKTYSSDWYKNEGPQRRVTISHTVAIAKHETTFELWDLCVAEKGCKTSPKDEGWGRGKRPVIDVSWDDITNEFLPWLNRKLGIAPTAPDRYRLPSEAEWEYAARAGTTGDYSFPSPITAAKANYDATSTHAGSPKGTWRKRTVAVDDGGFPLNPWGLAHVHGNAWEWVQDCFVEGYGSAPIDGAPVESGSCSARVLRGGSWSNVPQLLRSAARSWLQPGGRLNYLGFRLARTLPPTP